MSFPKPDEYNIAVQNPENCFSDDDLRFGKVQTNKIGLPVAYSGGFTTTYKVFTDNSVYASRCFVREVRNLVARYDAIGDFRLRSRCPYLVDADVLKNGILVGGKWYPIIKMRWVEGDLLNVYIQKILNRNKHDIEEFLTKFEEFAYQLEKDEIAHGDLQHGNIIIKNNRIYLIDYDGIYLPEIESLGTGEVGHPNFQHPDRTTQSFDRNLDRFSVIVIWLSIKSILHEPDLWKKYNNGENLIFLKNDFQTPEKSEIFYKLSQGVGLKEDILKLVAICKGDFKKIPSLRDFIDGNFSYSKFTIKKPAKTAKTITTTEQEVFNKLYGAPSNSKVGTSAGGFHYTPSDTFTSGDKSSLGLGVLPKTQTGSYSPVSPAPSQNVSPSSADNKIGSVGKAMLWLMAISFFGWLIFSSNSENSNTNTSTPVPTATTCSFPMIISEKTGLCVTRNENCVETKGVGSSWDGNYCTSPCTTSQCLFNGTCVNKPANSYCASGDLNNAWKCSSGYQEVGNRCVVPTPVPTPYISSCGSGQCNYNGSCITKPFDSSCTSFYPGYVCNSGYYKVQGTGAAMCLNSTEMNNACSDKYPNSGWNGVNPNGGKFTCDCGPGYIWNSAGTACIIANAQQWCDTHNPQYVTEVHQYTNGSFLCSCYSGYGKTRTAYGSCSNQP